MTILLQGAGIQTAAAAPVPPLFVSAEVGTVNASTVAVTFDQDVSASGSDYSSGVTIKVNGSTRAFESGIRQANHAIVYYALSSAVVNGDTVTWEYAKASGNIVAEDDSTPLEDVTAQSVTNNVPIDPGIALRADAVAYWPMEEAGLSNRADSTAHHLDLSLDYTVPIANDTGKIGNAAKWVDDTGGNFSDLQTLSLGSTDFSGGICVAFWSKFNQFVPDDDQNIVIARISNDSGIVLPVAVGILVDGQPEIGFYVEGLASAPAAANEWHFVVAYKDDAISGMMHIQVDNGAIVSAEVGVPYSNPDRLVYMGLSSLVNNVDTVWIDEFALFARVLTTGERTYLYNSGAGRALFPAP